MPEQQQLGVSLQFDFKLHTFLDNFDVLDFIRESAEVRGAITQVIQKELRKEDEGTVIIIEDVSFAAGSQPLTVVQYFVKELDSVWPYPCNVKNPASPAHPDFHIETGCGSDCKDAIDAAAVTIKYIRKGFGDDRPELIADVVKACAEVVRVFVYG